MPIDSRLREGLKRSMSAVHTDAERHLGDARRQGHRRLVIRRAAAVVAIAATIAIVAVAAPGVLDIVRNQHRQPATPPSLLPISGTYTTAITAKDTSGNAEAEAVGKWLLTLDGNGTLELASLTNGDLGRSVTQYQTTGKEFLTTALAGGKCSGLGTYTWLRSGSTLTFAVVSDPCPLRVAIFTSHPWTSQ